MIEQERFFPGHDPDQLPDFESLVIHARSGNQEAFRELDDYLRPHLHRYFSRRLREEADDLTQETMIGVTTSLDVFKARGEGTYSKRFIKWCMRIAKNKLNDEFRIQAKRKSLIHIDVFEEFAGRIAPHLDEHDSQVELNTREKHNALMVRLKENLDEVLPPTQREIVKQTMEGKNTQEIATQLMYKKRSVISLLSAARVKIENTLLSPAGYIRTFRFGQTIKAAAHNRRVPGAIQFLGMWYITQESVHRYHQTKQAVDQELINQGYVLLSQNASLAEATAMQRHNPDALVFQRGRFYIKPESIDAFRQTKKENGTTINPPEGYYTLTAFTQTQMDTSKLRRAAKKGKLKAIKRGRYWFTTQGSVDEFRQDNQGTLPKDGVIFSTKE